MQKIIPVYKATMMLTLVITTLSLIECLKKIMTNQLKSCVEGEPVCFQREMFHSDCNFGKYDTNKYGQENVYM